MSTCRTMSIVGLPINFTSYQLKKKKEGKKLLISNTNGPSHNIRPVRDESAPNPCQITSLMLPVEIFSTKMDIDSEDPNATNVPI